MKIFIDNFFDENKSSDYKNKNQNLPKRKKRINNADRVNKRKKNGRLYDNEEIKEKVEKIFEFIGQEKNEFEYRLAIKYDKRKYIQYYISLLKTQHEFIFAFFQNNDYKSRIIKIDFFFITFVMN